jgi:signal transduction histidine kinase
MHFAKVLTCFLLVAAVIAAMMLQNGVHDAADVATGESARRLVELDAQLDRAVLESHTGLTRDYDDVAATLRELSTTLREMDGSTKRDTDPILSARMAAAHAHFAERERVVETFESLNSVLRNSVAFFPAAAVRARGAAPSGSDGENTRAGLAALLVAILQWGDRSSADSVTDIQRGIAALRIAVDALPREERAPGEVALRHAQVFLDYAPRVDASVRTLTQMPGPPDGGVASLIRNRRERALRRANVYRAGLAIVSAALLIALGMMVVRLRRVAAALRRAFERVEHEKSLVEEKQVELANLNLHLEERVLERTRDLSASREQYRVLLETTQAIPFELDAAARQFTYLGPQAAALLGYTELDWGRSGFLAAHIHAADCADVFERLDYGMRGGQDEIEFRMATSSGGWVWLRALMTTPIVGPRVVRRGILLDVTARRVLETSLRASQKLESVGRLAAGIAHEINTPVQFVGDNVRFVLDASATLARVLGMYRVAHGSPELKEAEQVADVDYILEEIPRALASSCEGLERVATIVRAMKGFAHPDRADMAPADLNANIQDTLLVARNEYQEVAELVTDLRTLPPVYCHAGQINQVLLNLVTNAAHAVAEVVAKTGRRGRIDVRSWREARDVIVSVRDTGFGIPTEIHEKLFEPFFTTKDVGRGTGQGLAIARSLVVDMHGGEITFDSDAGLGTEFRVRIPIEGRPCAAELS